MPVGDLADFPEYAQAMFSLPGMSNFMRLKTPACTGPVALSNPNAVQVEIERMKRAVQHLPRQPEELFMTAASPGVIALFLHNSYYPSYEAYVFAIADAMRSEYKAIVDAGLILQLDCPDLAMGRHLQFANSSLDEFRKNARTDVDALNHALDGIPPDRVRMHLCWANYEGPHHRDVPFKDIADIVFTARPTAVLVEAANPRHEHEWAVFEDVKLPDDKVIVPGVIDSTSNFIEHPDLVAQRIVRYAKLVGRENVMAGVDCGFGTFAGVGFVDPKIVWAKLASLAEGARIASDQLW
jgi:5-methyltetrahydropteroyltriglutamate--homocysteine methyltransferase